MSSHALVIVPHCDDVDYYCGGTMAAWAVPPHRQFVVSEQGCA